MKYIRMLFIVILVVMTVIPVCAHSGKTDANGGHNSSSGYHYHHGYPAHDHNNGTCPYNFDDKTNHKSKSVSKETAETKAEKVESTVKSSGLSTKISAGNSASSLTVSRSEKERVKYLHLLIYVVSAIVLFSISKMLWPVAEKMLRQKPSSAGTNLIYFIAALCSVLAFPMWIVEWINSIPKNRSSAEQEWELKSKHEDELRRLNDESSERLFEQKILLTEDFERRRQSSYTEEFKTMKAKLDRANQSLNDKERQVEALKKELDKWKIDPPISENEYQNKLVRMRREHAQELNRQKEMYNMSLQYSEAYNKGYADAIKNQKNAKEQE